jgi:hypothetical protein
MAKKKQPTDTWLRFDTASQRGRDVQRRCANE